MFCKKCGTELSTDAKFCIKCGTRIENNNMEDIKGNVNDLKQNQIEKVTFDEMFVKAYMGNKADIMYDKGVKEAGLNIWAILFGFLYFAYRKMYLVSMVGILILDIIAYIIPKVGNYVGLLIGFMFYPLYYWDITRKLRKIKENNPDANEEQLLDIAKKKGGTSVLGAITFFVVYFLILLLFTR